MLKPIITSLSLSSLIACVAGTAARPLEPTRAVSCAFKAEPVSAAFPVAIDPQLPSVDRIARLVEGDLGPRAAADVKVCVSPAGRVVAISLVRESLSRAFNAAVLHDVAEWQFIVPTATAGRICKRATISYLAATRMAAR